MPAVSLSQAAAASRRLQPPSNASGFPAWFMLIGIFTPGSMTVYLGDAKFIPGRIAVSFLLVPALFELFRRGRRLVASDIFVCAASIWLIGATIQADSKSWPSAAAMVLEFSGAYVVARAFFFGERALLTLVRILKLISIVAISLATLEQLSQQIIINNFIATLWGEASFVPEYRNGLMRAYSVFAHPIFYGTFCAIAAAIFLYSEKRRNVRIIYVGACFFGCVLAMSSASLISFMIVISVYCYDYIMRRYSWRWRALITALCMFFFILFLSTNKPVSWIIEHLTLDPSTGYFRVATWDNAFYYIGLSPFVGYGFETYADQDDFFGNATVDSVWLVLALRSGIPLVILILLMNVASFYRSGHIASVRHSESYMNDMRTAFTLVIVIFMFAGLTVHYWNNIWMFWGACVGIRGALREQYFRSKASSIFDTQANVRVGRVPQPQGSSGSPA